MDNAVQALMISFGLLVLVIALSISVYMFTQVTAISERLLYFTDKTNYYDSIRYEKVSGNENNVITASVERYVDLDTIIPTLYRYDKENFCVKVYDARTNPNNGTLLQVFDVNLEGRVRDAISDDDAKIDSISNSNKVNYALKQTSNNPATRRNIYMFGAPWTGNTENIKKRVDYFINGDAGYIKDVYVDYTNNPFHTIIRESETNENIRFKERFINYSFSGNTFESEEGDEFVTTDSKDKTVIIYTIVEATN